MLQRIKASRPVEVVKAYGKSKAGNHANGLALRAFLTMFPLILGLLSLLGLVVRDQATLDRAENDVAAIFPGDAHDQIINALSGVRHSAGILGIVSILGLLWSGTGLFASMEWSLGQVIGTTQRDMVRQRAMGLIMMVVFLAAVVVSVAATSVSAAIPMASIASFIVGAAVMVGLLAAIYRFVPNRSYTFREVLPGAILGGVLIQVLTFVFPIYAKVVHGFNTYGQQFALFFLIATWLLYLSQFLLLGAVYIRLRAGRPADEGLVAAPDKDSQDTPRPAEAIETEQREDTQAGGDQTLVGRRSGTAPGHAATRTASDGTVYTEEEIRTAERRARIALGAGAAAAIAGLAARRVRKGR